MSVPQWNEVQANERNQPPGGPHFRFIIVCGIIGLLCIGLALFIGFVVQDNPKPPNFPDRVHVHTVPGETR